jgi:tRNA modification GTPase
MATDTIAAVATAPGRAAVGIVRVSGPLVRRIASAILDRPLAPRQATIGEFRDDDQQALDRGLALFFPGPHSYTGEDVLELHGHGGAVITRLLLERCVTLGARIAEPGEFTRRAFLNGKLDLAQAESVIDLIDASTASAARSAIRSLRGEFSQKIQALRWKLLELRALVEATLDFPEEEIDVIHQADAQARLEYIRRALNAVLDTAQQGRLLREGSRVVLAGRPNVGKSSLLNKLAGESLAIVTDVPGTTRDTVREVLSIGGVPFHIIDTAGLREARDPIEALGIDRTRKAIESADIVVVVQDASSGETEDDRHIIASLPAGPRRIRVMNKVDLLARAASQERLGDDTLIWLSAKSGAGLGLLHTALLETTGWHATSEAVFLARARHIEALQRANRHLALAQARTGDAELFAEELRLAHEALGSILGRVTADEVLTEIFSRFCIGK